MKHSRGSPIFHLEMRSLNERKSLPMLASISKILNHFSFLSWRDGILEKVVKVDGDGAEGGQLGPPQTPGQLSLVALLRRP